MGDSLSISAKDWLKLIILSVLWGVSFIFMEVALTELGVFTIVAARVGIAALALNVIIGLQGRSLIQYKSHFGRFFIMGLVGNAIPFCLIVWGQIYITASLSAILNATLPFFTLVIAHMVTQDEKMTVPRIFALLIGFAGVVVIINPLSAISAPDQHMIWGEIAVILAVFCYSLTIIYGRRFGGLGVPPLVAAAGQMSVSTVLILPLAFALDGAGTFVLPSLNVIVALLGVSLLSTAAAFAIWYHLLNRIGSNNTSLVTFLIPVSAIVMGYVLLGEQLAPNHAVGLVLIVLGLAVINRRVLKRQILK